MLSPPKGSTAQSTPRFGIATPSIAKAERTLEAARALQMDAGKFLWMAKELGLKPAQGRRGLMWSKSDIEVVRMSGTWRIVRSEHGGKATDQGDAGFVIHGYRFERQTRAHVFRRTITLDLSKQPSWIDLTSTDPADLGQVFPGIYEFEGEELRICHASPEQARPSKVSSIQNGHLLLIARRVRPGEVLIDLDRRD